MSHREGSISEMRERISEAQSTAESAQEQAATLGSRVAAVETLASNPQTVADIDPGDLTLIFENRLV